ncbi:MAG: hypothetical protein HZA82_03195 [Thaumarchaeota archaeon]|nr:hypothetical protein [Nitrososphaerota archaeon]
MNLKAISGLSILVLLLGVTSSSYHLAFALESTNEQSLLKKGVQSIMNDYKVAVAKAKSDLLSSIVKANTNAKLAIQKGIPIDEINTVTKTTIIKAKTELKLDLQKAKAEAKTALIQLKAAVDKNKLS